MRKIAYILVSLLAAATSVSARTTDCREALKLYDKGMLGH
jgi:hypothetical protein